MSNEATATAEKIEKSFEVYEATVPLPPLKHNFGDGRPSKYPFDTMKVGEFMVVGPTTTKQFGGTVRAAEQRTGFAFAVRSGPITHNGETVVPEGSIGIWRIAEKPARKARTNHPENVAVKQAA